MFVSIREGVCKSCCLQSNQKRVPVNKRCSPSMTLGNVKTSEALTAAAIARDPCQRSTFLPPIFYRCHEHEPDPHKTNLLPATS